MFKKKKKVLITVFLFAHKVGFKNVNDSSEYAPPPPLPPPPPSRKTSFWSPYKKLAEELAFLEAKSAGV
jgi:hypothetical protein